MDGIHVTVGACREADEPAVLALLADAFGRWPTGIDADPRAFFRWKHSASPLGPSTKLVAKVDGEVAGFLALMPWRLRFGEAVLETRRGVDIAVGVDFQRHGVAKALIKASRDNYSGEIAMAWSNPNERSRPGVLKAGRKRVDGLPRFVGLGGGGSGTVRRFIGIGRPAPVDGDDDDDSLAAALADRALLERVLSGPGPSGRISTAYDPDLLRWRYGEQGRYRAVVGEHPRAGAGLAIYRVHTRGRYSVARVCELLTERDDARAGGELVRGVRRAARTDLLACAFASPRAAARSGLVRSRRKAMIAANPLHHGLEPDPIEPSSWALSLGDLELI